MEENSLESILITLPVKFKDYSILGKKNNMFQEMCKRSWWSLAI